jgi:diadenosine tetraphosphate (Ap4A) HIT family hydrolase
MNATITKFGYPATLLHEYLNWVVLLRPDQATLGSMVLVSKTDARSLSALGGTAFAQLSQVVGDLEHSLRITFNYDKINYLLFMMADPHVHFHVVPRYAGQRDFSGATFRDVWWPDPPILAPPDRTYRLSLSDQQRLELLALLKSNWPTADA